MEEEGGQSALLISSRFSVSIALAHTSTEEPMEGLYMGVSFFVLLALYVLWAARSAGYLRGPKPLSRAQRTVLARYGLHYQRLRPAQKPRYERIVSIFVNDKEWVGAGIVVTEEMKVMIGACAAQLLHGFEDVELMHFDRIVVYPDSYRSHRSGRLQQGEVRPRVGMIIISWHDFLQGYTHSGDAHNVGLHEMAHAIWFENTIINGEDHFLHPPFLQKWNELATIEIANIHAGEHGFFRDYAGTNDAEFFAVAVEYLFERPLEFRDARPELYAHLCGLLKQDPATVLSLN
ncbi:MAG: zinc-dependent peptidase [Flavobacteriales bacterium]